MKNEIAELISIRIEFISQKLFLLLIVCIIETGRASPVSKRQVYAPAGPITHYEDTILRVPFAEYGKSRKLRRMKCELM